MNIMIMIWFYVFEDGRPVEHNIIRKGLAKVSEKAGLPPVVFHSLRHSSTTYKLKLNHGDIKATQGDTGHAQADMVTDLYSHILDEDRKINAQKSLMSLFIRTMMKTMPKGRKIVLMWISWLLL